MASYLRNALAKAMSKYFKNIQQDMFTLSFFRGEAELNDLELRPEVLQHLLDLPPWLKLKKATIGSIRASVTWTKIKSQAIRISISEMQIKLEATANPDDFHTYDPLDPDLLAAEGPVKVEKYGFIDHVTDGVMIEVNNIDISLHGPDFDGTVHIIHMVFESCTKKWEATNDLKNTREENRTPQKQPGFRPLPPHVTLYKRLTIHQLRGWISPLTNRISEAASADPFMFSIDKPKIRIFKQKSLDDNTKVLSMHMTLDINLIKQELSRFQIQTLNHFTWSITRMMAATRGLMHNEETLEAATADSAVGTDFGLHLKIKEIELSLKNHIHTLGQDDFLTSLHIYKVHAHHFAEKRVGTKLESNDSLRQEYLRECAAWMKSVNNKWSKASRMSKDEKKRLRQATTSIIVGRFEIVTRPQMSNKARAKMKRGSDQAVKRDDKAAAIAAAVDAEPTFGAPDGVTRIALLQCNYEEFRLPEDLPILQLDIVSFFMLPEAATSPTVGATDANSPAAPTDASTSTTSSDTTTATGPRGTSSLGSDGQSGSKLANRASSLSGAKNVPPAATFGRLNPVKMNLNLPAVLNLAEFANSCRLAAPAMSGETSSATFEELSVEISLCPSTDRMLSLWHRIDHLATSTESNVNIDEIKELRRVYLMRVEELKSLSEADNAAEFSDADFAHYSMEVNLPTVVLPKRLDGPTRVRSLEMRFTMSRATITNALLESRFAEMNGYDDFYSSPLVTAEGASQVDIPVGITDGARTVHPLPRRSWLPRKGGDAPDVMHVQIDELWGDVVDATGKKRPLMHRVKATVFAMDSSAKAKRDLQSAQAKQVTEEEAGSPEVMTGTHPIFASSYTLIAFNNPLQLDLNNSSLMFLSRVSEEFTKLSSLMDDGSAKGHSFAFVAIDSINVSLYAEKHMLQPAKMTKGFIEEQGAHIGQAPFHYVSLSKLHVLSHTGNRIATQMYAIEDISLSATHPSDTTSPRTSSQSPQRKPSRDSREVGGGGGTDGDGSRGVGHWDKVSLAMRMRTPLASAEHTYRFYQQLDAVLIEKEAGPRDGGGSAVDLIQRQTNLGQCRNTDAASTGTGGGSGTGSGTGSMGGGGGDGSDVEGGPSTPGASDLGPNLLYYLAAKKEGGAKKRELELNFLPRTEMRLEVRGLSLKIDSDTVTLLGALTEDYFPDDTFPPPNMHLNVADTDVVLIDKAVLDAKRREHFRLRSPEETATNYYRLDGVTIVRDGNRWAVSTGGDGGGGGGTGKPDGDRGLKDIKKDETVSRLQSELESARELIAAQKLALEQAEATRASLLAALDEVKK
eukprot:m.183721 g.183721  ORF g.183721 m.183721 type:complete len:1306 (+) comp15926_c0_seq1:168-4085(+)